MTDEPKEAIRDNSIEYAFKYGAMKGLLELLPKVLQGQGIINSKQSVKVQEYIQEQLKDTQKRYEEYIENR